MFGDMFVVSPDHQHTAAAWRPTEERASDDDVQQIKRLMVLLLRHATDDDDACEVARLPDTSLYARRFMLSLCVCLPLPLPATSTIYTVIRWTGARVMHLFFFLSPFQNRILCHLALDTVMAAAVAQRVDSVVLGPDVHNENYRGGAYQYTYV